MIYSATTPNGQQYTASVTLAINAPTDVVWAAVSSPQGWNKWFTSGAAFNCAEGERYTTADGDTGRFTSIVPGRLVAFTWEHAKHPPGSIVTARLDPDGEGSTKLHLTHGPWERTEHAKELEAAWTNILGVLKRRLEGPAAAKE